MTAPRTLGVDTEATRALVHRIESSLVAKSRGLKVWFDKRDMRAGEDWQKHNTVRHHSAYGGLPPAPETIKPSAWFLRMPQLLGPPMAQGLT